MKRALTAIFTAIVLTGAAAAVSLDQANAERILRENRYFLEFINVSISNFGTQKNIEDIKKAYEHNFKANLDYLQGKYVKTYKKIRLSQEILKNLYLELLDQYLVDARKLLDHSAPIIVNARDKKAQLFLRLGYRDLETAKQFKDTGYHYNRFLYSNKIRYYIDGIKRARRAKRFAFLALIESKTPLEEKDQYKTQTIDEALRKTEREEVSDYERVKNLLTNMINRQLFEDAYNFFLHHNDNYNYVHKTKKSVIKEIIEDENRKQMGSSAGTSKNTTTTTTPDSATDSTANDTGEVDRGDPTRDGGN